MRTRAGMHDESGVALITALLAVMLISGLMAGMFAALTADQRSHAVDRDQSQAYAAAHAGLEKLTASLGNLFLSDFSPSSDQIDTVDSTPPAIPGFEFKVPGGTAGSGYAVSFTPDANGNPAANANADITTGPFTGFKGLITPYTLTVTARSAGGSEVRLRREIQTVAVPVFQFGVFSERNVSFHSGSNFDFGGRVHTNGHLYLASGNTFTLTFRDKITAVGQVIRQQLENGNAITNSTHTGNVSIPTVIGSSYRNLAATEGSVTAGPGSAAWSGWKNLSEATYNTNIRNTLTGAKRLDLPLVSQGAAPIDLIRRPALGSNEHTTNGPVYQQRYYAMASLRILLSDRATDLTGLPEITAGAPVELSGDWIAAPPTGYTVGANRPPLARAIGPSSTTISGTASTYSSGLHQLRVTAIPAAMLLPPLTVGAATNVTCTTKTANQFSGCTGTGLPAGGVPAGTPVSAVLPSGATVSTVSTGAAVAGTINVAAGATMPFANDFAWINDRTNNRPTPMSCEGYVNTGTPRRLTNCRILGVTNAQTTSGRAISTHSLPPENTSLIGGFIKIERKTAAEVWEDVTLEILNLGFAAPNQEGAICADPTPNAVIRFQRLRDNGGGTCTYAGSTDSRDYWPNVLFDAREATYRDMPTNEPMTMGGIMNYVTLDVGNLARWLSGAIGTSGTSTLDQNGYIVYFSDHRGNHNDALPGAPETGEYGNEDSINSSDSASADPNGVLEDGESRNEDNVLDTYGALASPVALYGGAACTPPLCEPFNGTATPLTRVTNHPAARVNRQVLFRRALKLVNGGISSGVNRLPATGLTVTTDNPVYVQGNYNATSASATAEPNVPAAIIGDAVTILSNSWTDVSSLNSPNDRAGRVASNTGYRFALIAGKSIAFPKPAWASLGNWGTDGGIHNFMRMLEDWNGFTAYYRGSIVSLYTARQATGIFKNNTNVYYQPTRNFSFDVDFLTPALLPPGTPMFRDVNTLRFRQLLRPNQ